MDAIAKSTPYEPLSSSDAAEIRLLRLYPGHFDDRPRCELEHYSLSEDDNQPYIALSYTWGNPNLTETIKLNGILYSTTANLHSFLCHAQVILLTIIEVVPSAMRQLEHQVSLQMLVYDILDDRELTQGISRSSLSDISKIVENKLRQQLECGFPGQTEKVEDHMKKLYCPMDEPPDLNKTYLKLWIDAVCINQQDLLEKSQQICRMKYIYARTMKLLVWLSYPDPRAELGPYLDWVVDRADELAFFGASLGVSLEDSRLEEKIEQRLLSDQCHAEALVALGVITQHPWFTRAWIIQEIACGSKRATFLLGLRPLLWSDLKNLWTFCHVAAGQYPAIRRRLLDLRARNLGILEEVTRFYECSLESRELLYDGTANIAAETLSLLLQQTGGSFQATNPRDVLYALLGLLQEDDIPHELVPDYTLPVSRVFRDYAIYLARNAHYIEFLDTCGKQLADGPSWAPDWTCFRRGTVDNLQPARVPPSRVEVSADGSCLVLEGVLLGEVIDVIFPVYDMTNLTDIADKGCNGEDDARLFQVVQAYRALKQGCKDHWTKAMSDPCWGDFECHWTEFWAPIAEDRLDLDVVEFMENNPDRWDKEHGEGELQRRVDQVDHEIKSICKMGMAILEGGNMADIFQGDKGVIEKGYIVCMMKGLRMPCMLRPDGIHFRFVSTCGHTIFRLTNPGEAFYCVNDVQLFSLV
jgi:hypothetical protein